MGVKCRHLTFFVNHDRFPDSCLCSTVLKFGWQTSKPQRISANVCRMEIRTQYLSPGHEQDATIDGGITRPLSVKLLLGLG